MMRYVVSLLVLSALPQIAAGQGQVVSYQLPTGTGDRDIATVPSGGLVVTDIIFAAASSLDLVLEQVDSNGAVEKFHKLNQNGYDGHFQSGIVFDAGSTIHVNVSNTTAYTYTISGYIPTTAAQGKVPAVSTWGLVILGMLILIVASSVLTRRKTA